MNFLNLAKYEATSSFAPPDGRERVKLGLGATATIAVRTAQAKGVFGIFNRAYSAHHVQSDSIKRMYFVEFWIFDR
jgi:hypothetical protein